MKYKYENEDVFGHVMLTKRDMYVILLEKLKIVNENVQLLLNEHVEREDFFVRHPNDLRQANISDLTNFVNLSKQLIKNTKDYMAYYEHWAINRIEDFVHSKNRENLQEFKK